MPLGDRIDLFYLEALGVDDRFSFRGGLLLCHLLGGAVQDDVFDLDLHGASSVELNRQDT
ncbi:MAG: hypothetical protein CMP30_10955 [Roseibacillus sp.]|nr:hypothetical protein [Roseibacillus sp.]